MNVLIFTCECVILCIWVAPAFFKFQHGVPVCSKACVVEYSRSLSRYTSSWGMTKVFLVSSLLSRRVPALKLKQQVWPISAGGSRH